MTQWLMEWNAAITLDVEEDERVPHPSGEPDAEDIPIGNVTQMQRKAIHEQVSRGLDVALRHEDLDNESRLSILSTSNTAVGNHLDSFDEQAGNLPTVEAFAEIELDPEGISMSLYRESDTEHGRVDLVDENWRTWGRTVPRCKDSAGGGQPHVRSRNAVKAGRLGPFDHCN